MEEYPDVEDEDIFGDAAIHDRYEDIKRGELHLTDLQKMTVPQLIRTAKTEGIAEYIGLKKQDLVFKILKERIQQERPDVRRGRAGDPARRLRLPPQPGLQLPALPRRHLRLAQPDPPLRPARPGHIVAGQIRPPKETETYFALLRVEAINFEDPDKLTEKVNFEDLTPAASPTGRIVPGDRHRRDQHARRGPGHADRLRPAHADRRPAAHRQDRPAPEDRQRRHRTTTPTRTSSSC